MVVASNSDSRWHTVRKRIHLRLATSRALHFDVPTSLSLGTYNRAKEYLKKLRTGVDAMSRTGKAQEDAHVVRKAEETTRTAQKGNVVLQVEEEHELDAIPMWQQGDESLGTVEKLRQRKALRKAPKVVEVIGAFWDVSLRTPGHTIKLPDSIETLVTREAYFAIMMRAYKVLLDEWDPVDAEDSIEADWENDSQGATAIPYVAFFDALFEVADLWVPAIDEKYRDRDSNSI